MSVFLDADVHRAASHRNMVDHLTAPLQAGAVDSRVVIRPGGAVPVAFDAREPLLLLGLATDLAESGLRVSGELPGGETITLRFEPFSERGAFLPVYRPPVQATGLAAPFTVRLRSLALVAPSGAEQALAAAEIAARLEARLVEGVLGRMLYLLGAEKQRLRRTSRELAAMRGLAHARDNALDRVGAELGVPRFADTLAFRSGEIVTDVRREPDEEYRRRLAVYRPWLRPTKGRILELLNGPGEPESPNRGPIGALGLADRFTLVERDNDFAVAVAIVGAEDPDYRSGFLEVVRAVHLILPRDDATSNAVHAARSLAPARRAHEQELREGLRRHFSFAQAPDVALAPMLAAALVRVSACRRALGAPAKLNVLRAQKPDAGSRYELGLGADLEPIPGQQLTRMAQAHATRQPDPDPEIEGLLASMTPVPAKQDPEGRWLLEPCGLKTVHRVNAGTVYVSHLPVFGLAISGPAQLQPTGWTQILEGNFGSRHRSDLLFYERATGTGEFYRTDGQGRITLLRNNGGWRTSWTTILAGNFAPGPFDDLLFYERSSGSAEIYSTDGAGNIALVRAHTGWRRTWSAIVLGRFHSGPLSDLFFYDRSTGTAELYAVAGAGEMTLLKAHAGLPRTWTHVVPGNFTESPFTDLLTYDRSTGTVEIYATDGVGGLELVRRITNWHPSLTHLVPGQFGPGGFTSVLAYDRGSGRVELHASDGQGRLVRVRRYPRWRRTWTHVVPARLGASGYSDLLLYERSTGTAEMYLAEGRAGPILLRAHSGWRKSSGQLYEARYHAPGDPGRNVVLVNGLRGAAAAWADPPFSGPPWTVLSDAAARARWQTAAAPNAAVRNVFGAAGLPGIPDPALAVQQLLRLPPELVETVELDAGQAAVVIGGNVGAARQLRDLVSVFRAQGIASALPLVTAAGEVLLVLGAIGLPEAGINLSDRRSSGFRWYLVPIQGTGGELTAVGSRTLFTPADAGVYALVVVGYARTGQTDPYEYRVELPGAARLDPLQYEFLMNVLEHTFPIGIEVNTYAIRQDHVDLDGDGDAEPLTPTISKTYRAFRRRRHRGEVAVTLDDA